MEVGFKTDKGLRRSNNEDACFVMKRDKVFIVADGVGGNNSGEIASRTCVNEIAKYVENGPLTGSENADEVRAYFEDCLRDVNFKVLEMSQRFEWNKGMATTVVVAYIQKDTLYIMNVGDSRGYILRNGELTQITEDHTYVNTLLKAGLISEDEAEHHENKNMITRAVGADYTIEADFFQVQIKPQDRILICTDGLYGEVDEPELVRELEQDKPMTDICSELVDVANRNGGSDNITMVVLKVTEEDFDE
ncbi:Stp1/IreP family PP2C-type Ser/Thr phosphatase [Ihubacter sp. rT4E-8]|uniref:Stp1/IreP family PP2C-type Ser/Thr phosphatase n=1 Tax=unclassified Ihubacter TaxID=2633299 RepID=UPI001379BCF7